MSIKIDRVSDYADATTFPDVASVEAEAAQYNCFVTREDYESDRHYVASLLDVPLAAVNMDDDKEGA